MLRTRVIPCLLLREGSLVKTIKFDKFFYIGDPLNTCRIFNELEVDELVFLDIMATKGKGEPNLKILQEISNECFMPVSYGGGIDNLSTVERVLNIGFEKVLLNSYPFENPAIITEIATVFGSQSVIVAIDVRKNILGKYNVYSHSGSINQKFAPVQWAKEVEERGAGEILLTSIDREGTWSGFDIKLIAQVSAAVTIPVIAHGGAGTVDDIGHGVKDGKASAVAIGSMVVFQGKDKGVLVNFPDRDELIRVLN